MNAQIIGYIQNPNNTNDKWYKQRMLVVKQGKKYYTITVGNRPDDDIECGLTCSVGVLKVKRLHWSAVRKIKNKITHVPTSPDKDYLIAADLLEATKQYEYYYECPYFSFSLYGDIPCEVMGYGIVTESLFAEK